MTSDRSEVEGSDDPLTQRLNYLITERPWLVIAIFLLLTGVFYLGIGSGEGREAGAEQFQEGLAEYRAMQAMDEAFARGGRSSGGSGISIFISDEDNVLSKENLLRMLTLEEAIHDEFGGRVDNTISPASAMAEAITQGEADTLDRQREVLERLTQTQIRFAIREAWEMGDLDMVSEDFKPNEGSATVTQMAVSFDTPPAATSDENAKYHYATIELIDEIEGFDSDENAIVLSGQIVQDEIDLLLTDTIVLVFPAAIILIVFFLLVAYRDPFDLTLGLIALIMTLVWTFGGMGFANVPFSDSLIPVFPLLLAVGIDFGIHIINRYREERAKGVPVNRAMRITSNQLGTAFLIVTITSLFGFAANITSPLETLRNFGIIATMGMIFSFFIFAVFLPACKVAVDDLREGTRIPEFGTTPLASDQSVLGRSLEFGVTIARVAPVIMVVSAFVLGAGAASYGTAVDTEFSMESFFPNEERIETYQNLPEIVRPSQYTFIPIVNHLEEDFETGWIGSVTVYVQDDEVNSAAALADIDRALTDPPNALESTDRRAEADSIFDPMENLADRDEEFAALLNRSDTTGDGVPNRNVDLIFDYMLSEGVGERYLSPTRTDTRIIYDLHVDTAGSNATRAAQTVADDMRLNATPTGQIVVDQVVIELITESALRSLVVAFILTAVFLMTMFRWLEGRAIYGVVNILPVLVVVGLLAGSMYFFDVPFSPFNAPILAVSIGLGVDYSVHFMHRFVDEFDGENVNEALRITIQGTGGALTGSMITTIGGLGVLYLAVIPLIMEFGLLLALGVFYAYAASIVVLPSTIVVWYRIDQRLEPHRPFFD